MFTLIPFGAVIAEAFTGMADGTFAGLENFILVVHNAAFRLAAKNTLRFMAVCIPLLMAVSLWTAVLVKAAADRSGVFKTTMLLPMAVPVASVGLPLEGGVSSSGAVKSASGEHRWRRYRFHAAEKRVPGAGIYLYLEK